VTNEIKSANAGFEEIKHIDEDGIEFWFARELQGILEYKKWDNFNKVIDTAKIACKISQHEVEEHFVDTVKTVTMPIGEQFGARGFPEVSKTPKSKKIKDYKLTRYACYLIVMNGDPRKEIIANGQTYFAVKTRQQEFNDLYNQLTEEDKRLFLRGDIKQKNMLLAEAAKNAGIITTHEYAVFQDYGYRGLYDGETAKDIAKRKNINPEKDSVLDYMGSLELAANLFRIAQTEDVMRKNNVDSPRIANDTHYRVGKIVREAMEKAGNTVPEQLPTPEKSITQIGKERHKQIKS
jgi:DNA-damage-inducible protein D